MKIAILESGNYFEDPDIFRVFVTQEKAIENIPNSFKRLNEFPYIYYEDLDAEKWLSIKEYEVEE